MERKRYSKEFKLQIIKEALESNNTALVARRYELNANMVHRWIREYHNGHFGNVDVAVLPDIDAKKLTSENDQLKKLLGEKDLEIAILRDLLKKANPHLLKKLK